MWNYKVIGQDWKEVDGNMVYNNPRQDAIDFINVNHIEVFKITESNSDIGISVTIWFKD